MIMRLALDAHHDLVLGLLEVVHGDDLAVLPRREQRRFVDQVGQVGAGEAGRAARQHGQIHVVRQRHLLGVHSQDLFAALHVRHGPPPPGGRSGPGRSSAGSSTSGRLVAAIRITPSLDSKPSISTSNWLSVCSRSS